MKEIIIVGIISVVFVLLIIPFLLFIGFNGKSVDDLKKFFIFYYREMLK